MAPHTSKWDFYYGLMYFKANGLSPKFMIKKEMFVWPIKGILKKLGGVPIDRQRNVGQVKGIIEHIESNENFLLVMCPEGTRKKVKRWKSGFIKIAQHANIPVIVGFVDSGNHEMGIKGELDMSGTDDEIMVRLKKYYVGMQGVHPENFTTGLEDED